MGPVRVFDLQACSFREGVSCALLENLSAIFRNRLSASYLLIHCWRVVSIGFTYMNIFGNFRIFSEIWLSGMAPEIGLLDVPGRNPNQVIYYAFVQVMTVIVTRSRNFRGYSCLCCVTTCISAVPYAAREEHSCICCWIQHSWHPHLRAQDISEPLKRNDSFIWKL